MRYFIEFAYNGTAYHGWQKQPNVPSVQEALEKALSILLRGTIETTGAGRTDTGVHASQAFAHFDANPIADIPDTIYRLNAVLPKDIAVHRIVGVHDEAHARFDAKWRTYHYFIHRQKEVFYDNLSWYFPRQLDVARMNEAATHLLSHNDFQCFSKVDTDVHSFICTIRQAQWREHGSQLVFTITANRFLRNMVRAVVGTLLDAGLGRISPDEVNRIIETRDRREAGFSAPAHGLYLAHITYDYLDNPSPDGSGSLLAPGSRFAAHDGDPRKPEAALQNGSGPQQL